MNYSIQPIQTTIPGEGTVTLTSIFMTIAYTVGSTEMYVPYSLLDANGKAWFSFQAVITEAEIDNWGTDDMYIVNLVAQQAGVTLV